MKLDVSRHLIGWRCGLFAFRGKQNIFLLLPAAWRGNGNLTDSWRAGGPCHAGFDQDGSDRLGWRHSLTFSFITGGLILSIIVIAIRQLYINLVIGVEVLNYMPKGYVNHRLRDDQKR
jgi:hypothetical protein